jgi:predicted small metal-binding protein
MAIRVLECRSLVPDSTCQLMFIGEEDEVAQAFADHAARSHGGGSGEHDRPAVDSKMQNAVFVSKSLCYIPDQYERTDNGGIRIPGPGVVVRRFYEEASAALDCKCQTGTTGGRCKIDISGHAAWCTTDTCTDCGWSTSIPTVMKAKTLLAEFESLQAPPYMGPTIEL